jgi:hypothetical protein
MKNIPQNAILNLVTSGSTLLEGSWDLLSVYSDAETQGDCGSGDFIAQEVDQLRDKQSGNITSVDVETPLMVFLVDFHAWDHSSAADVSGLLEDQHSD